VPNAPSAAACLPACLPLLSSYLLDASSNSSGGSGAPAQLRSVPSSRPGVFKDRQLSPLQVRHECCAGGAGVLVNVQGCAAGQDRHACLTRGQECAALALLLGLFCLLDSAGPSAAVLSPSSPALPTHRLMPRLPFPQKRTLMRFLKAAAEALDGEGPLKASTCPPAASCFG